MTEPQQAPQFDMNQVATDTAQQLGAAHGVLTLELTAQRAAYATLQAADAEKGRQLAEKDAELERARQTVTLLQQQLEQHQSGGEGRGGEEGPGEH